MAGEIKEKFNIFKELVELFNTKLKATIITVLVLSVIYLVWDSGRQKDKLYLMVIDEVRKQVPAEVATQTAPIKATADSTKAVVDGSKQTIDTLNSDVRGVLKDITKKYIK